MKLTLTPQILRLIDTALDEDRVGSDYTTLATVPSSVKASARIVARQDLCLAGLSIVQFLFRRFDPQIRFEVSYRDGEWVKAGETIIAVGGLAHALLLVERTALNFLGRLCGVATRSRVWSGELRQVWKKLPEAERSPHPPKLVDTRKTLPGWRELDKYAVQAGGAGNHRHDLAGGILIKDNHLLAAGGVSKALHAARDRAPHSLRLQVEVTTLTELDEAITTGAEAVLLDNMDDATLTTAVARCREAGVLSEVSGGVTREALPRLAAIGSDLISCGALTHSAPNADVALDFDKKA